MEPQTHDVTWPGLHGKWWSWFLSSHLWGSKVLTLSHTTRLPRLGPRGLEPHSAWKKSNKKSSLRLIYCRGGYTWVISGQLGPERRGEAVIGRTDSTDTQRRVSRNGSFPRAQTLHTESCPLLLRHHRWPLQPQLTNPTLGKPVGGCTTGTSKMWRFSWSISEMTDATGSPSVSHSLIFFWDCLGRGGQLFPRSGVRPFPIPTSILYSTKECF